MLIYEQKIEVMTLQSLIIPATKSLTVTNRLPEGNINEDIIYIGSDGEFTYVSYLFFDISAIPANASIIEAELVLFKSNNFFESTLSKGIYIYPLVDYFSSFTTFNNSPLVSTEIKSLINPATIKVAVLGDMTFMVTLWCMNKLPVTGVALISRGSDLLWQFGSARSNDKYDIPFLKVVTNKVLPIPATTCCPPIHSTPSVARKIQLVGTVAEDSKYNAVINLAVKRGATGTTDNYYVVDQFDNTSNYEPLPVDKTYNVAVIPEIQPGDTEAVEFFGSYNGE